MSSRNEFLDERPTPVCITLVTKKKLLDEPWLWTAINDAKTVDDDAGVLDYVRAVTNLTGSRPVDKVVGLDEFDVLTAAMTREHLAMPGMSRSIALRFRDKLTMRNIAYAQAVVVPNVGLSSEESEVPPGSRAWIVSHRHEVSAFGSEM